jgi:CobQ-like glutamine amidotransferase family enzyme
MDCKLFHFYPDLMSLYGSYANVALLERHLKDLGNTVTVDPCVPGRTADLSGADFLFMGAGTERSQRAARRTFSASAPSKGRGGGRRGHALRRHRHGTAGPASVTTPGGETYPGIGLADFTAGRERGASWATSTAPRTSTSAAVVGFMNKCAVISGVETPLLTSLAMGFGNEAERRPRGLPPDNVFASELTGPLLVKNPLLLGAVIAAIYARRGQPLPADIPAYPFEEQAYAVTAQQLKLRAEAGR